MEGVLIRGTATNANLGRPAAGKTGTTDEFTDAWFVGFTPELVCAVYLGNDDRKPLGNRLTGGVLAAPVWRDFMAAALKDSPISDFPKPDNVEEMMVCAKTGLLPSSKCAKTVSVTFITGTEPTQICYEGTGTLPEYIAEPKVAPVPTGDVPVISVEKKFPLLEDIEILKKDGIVDKNAPQSRESKKETLQSLVDELKKRLEQKATE